MRFLQIEIGKFKHYFLNLILIWLVFLLYKTLPFYVNFIKKDSLNTIFYLALAYTIVAFFFYLFTPYHKVKETKGTLILKAIKNFPSLNKEEKTAILFVIVKIFFLPIMLNFFFSNLGSFRYQIPNISNTAFSIEGFNLILFPFLLTTIFMIDTLYFAFGYAVEAGFLKNKIISVEPTFLGWFVALVCYPPFNSLVTKYTRWYANDYISFSSISLTFAIKLVIILLLFVYLEATIALGTRCSNLTNRGIVSKGPYAIIRHPAYISKNLAWWLTIIPIASLPAIASMSIWSFIYHLRTITEERHLSQDPNYIAYKNKVKYRYIPGIY